MIEFQKAGLPRARPLLRQPGKPVQDGHAFLVQRRRDRGEIRKVRAHRVQPDGTAGQKTAGAGDIGVFQYTFELVMRGAPRQQNPGNAMLTANLADGVEFLLRGLQRKQTDGLLLLAHQRLG